MANLGMPEDNPAGASQGPPWEFGQSGNIHSYTWAGPREASLTYHPFLDGNGRLGRMLVPLVLHVDGVLERPLLYLSLYFKQRREEYYARLGRVRTEGDWEGWLMFFAAGVIDTAENAVATAKRLADLIQRDRDLVREVTGRQRNHVYRYVSCVSLFSEGTEPLKR